MGEADLCLFAETPPDDMQGLDGAVRLGDVGVAIRGASLLHVTLHRKRANIEADLINLQNSPGLMRSFFKAPEVAYITDL
jgi:hypothetical protein